MYSHLTQNKSHSLSTDLPSPTQSASVMKSIKPSSSSRSLHLLIPLPGMFFPQISARLLQSPPLFSTALSSPLHSISFSDVYKIHCTYLLFLLYPDCLEQCLTQKANKKYLLGGRESVITESWQSYGGVKGIGRFCVTDSRNKQNKAGTGNANVSAASTAT